MVKRILGIVVLIAGIAMICISNYITTQVSEGKLQVSSAQKKVDQGNQLFGQNPFTKQLGQGVTGSAQKKINAGKQTIADYEVIAQRLQTGGIICIVVGAGLIIFSFFGNKKSRR